MKVMITAMTQLTPHVQLSIVDTLDEAWEQIDQILAKETGSNSRKPERRAVQSDEANDAA
jgi:hypothetical protein